MFVSTARTLRTRKTEIDWFRQSYNSVLQSYAAMNELVAIIRVKLSCYILD